MYLTPLKKSTCTGTLETLLTLTQKSWTDRIQLRLGIGDGISHEDVHVQRPGVPRQGSLLRNKVETYILFVTPPTI